MKSNVSDISPPDSKLVHQPCDGEALGTNLTFTEQTEHSISAELCFLIEVPSDLRCRAGEYQSGRAKNKKEHWHRVRRQKAEGGKQKAEGRRRKPQGARSEG
jgi:hypothetical protein